MTEPTQVYVVTSGEYSDYGISSIWLTYDEAKAEAGTWGRVEVWPVGANQRTLGTFTHSAQVDATTGAVTDETSSDWADIADGIEASILCWPTTLNDRYPNQIGIRVTADTQERADKVYSEVRARVLADISLGLPIEVIAHHKYVGDTRNPWVPTAT